MLLKCTLVKIIALNFFKLNSFYSKHLKKNRLNLETECCCSNWHWAASNTNSLTELHHHKSSTECNINFTHVCLPSPSLALQFLYFSRKCFCCNTFFYFCFRLSFHSLCIWRVAKVCFCLPWCICFCLLHSIKGWQC